MTVVTTISTSRWTKVNPFPRWCTRMIRPSHSSCFPSSLGSMENSTALCMCSASHYHEYVDVSENSGTPQIIHFNRVFHCKPSILGYHYFWKHPCGATLDLHIPYPYPARIKFKKAMAAPSNNLSDDIKWFVIFLGGGMFTDSRVSYDCCRKGGWSKARPTIL